MAFMKIATDGNFESLVIQAERPVLVDFWAPGCGPCEMIAPFLERVAEDYEGDIDVVKMNIHEHQQVSSGLGIRSIPTLILFQKGEIAAQITGAPEPQQLIDLLERFCP